MNSHYQKYLYKKYPGLYKNYTKSVEKSCMPWGFSCGNGWFNILNSLSAALTSLTCTESIDITVGQVKEKFGTLHFYYRTKGTSKTIRRVISELVHTAEIATYYTCVDCGDWGTIYNKGWIVVLCRDCRANYLRKRRKQWIN